MKQMRHINQLDLFSGIGGFHLGFERAGYQVKSFFSEIDKHAVAVYKQQFKNSTYVGSIKDVRGAELPTIDLITFGSPCQDFSLAGKRKGMEGERSSLILEAIRLIHKCRPRVFIWENVKGTFSSNNGADFWAIIQAFVNIGGYRLEWQLCNTSWFLPQNRERIYLVGYSTIPGGDWRGIFPIGEGGGQNNNAQRIGDVTRATTTAHSHGTAKHMSYVKVKSATSKGYEVATEGDSINLSQPNSDTRRGRVGKGKAQTLETSCNQAVVEPIIGAIRGRNPENPNDNSKGIEYKQRFEYNKKGTANALTSDVTMNMVVEPKIIGYTRDAQGKVTDRHLKDEAGTIHASTGAGGNTDQFVQQHVKVGTWRTHKDGQGFREVKDGNCPTIQARAREDGSGQPVIENNYRIRRLTPIECERLQGFPDNHTEYGNYDGEIKKISNTQRYKQCGNAVTVDVVQAIAEQLKTIFDAK